MATLDTGLTSPSVPAPVTSPRHWLMLAAVLLLALAVRVPFLTDAAFPIDLVSFARWMNQIEDTGLTQFYEPELRLGSWDRPYPPLSTLLFGAMIPIIGSAPEPTTSLQNSMFVMLLKLLPLTSELALIAAIQIWLSRTNARLSRLIPGALAISPALIITSAWWGQYDAPFTLFLLLALLALNRDRPVAAWVAFAVALLLKQPAAVLGPLLVVITFRRYGWRTLVLGGVTCAGLYAIVSAPFILSSGLQNTLAPYLNASDAFPYLTNNAYNSWYAAAALHKGGPVLHMEQQFQDSLPILGGLSGKSVGFGLFGAYTLFLCAVVWRQAASRREFVWAAALYMGFFMLPTQVHERYLYPAAVFAVVAIARDQRFLWPAVGLALTFTYNLLAVAIPSGIPGAHVVPEAFALPTALGNVAMFALITRATLIKPPLHTQTPQPIASNVPDTPAATSSARTTAAFLVFALLAVGIVTLHTIHFSGRAYRQDEAWIVHGALERGGPQAMTQWVSTNIHPPLWVIVANTWVDTFGQHENMTRALSGLLTLLALALLFRLGADLAGSPRSLVPLVAVLIVGTSPFFQFYMHEFRPYPALVACTLAASLTFLRWLRRPTFRRALLFVACGIIALYVHFFSVYILAALLVYSILFVRWDSGLPLRTFGLILAIGLAYLGWILPFFNALLVTNPGGINYAVKSTWDTVTRIYRQLSFQPRELYGMLFLTAILMPVHRIVGSFTRNTPGDMRAFGQDTSWRKSYPLFIGLAIFGLAFAVNAVISNLTLRSLTLLLPFAALVAAFAFVALPRAAQLALLVFIVPPAFTFVDYEWPGPQAEVAAYMAPLYQPGSPIIIDISYVPRQIAVNYYVQQRMGAPVPNELVWLVINPNQPYTDFLPYEPVNRLSTGSTLNLEPLHDWLEENEPAQVWVLERNGAAALSHQLPDLLDAHYERVNTRIWDNEYTAHEYRRQ